MSLRRIVPSLALALALVGLLLYGVGWEEVVANLERTDPSAFAAALVAGATILALRGLIVNRLLGPIEGAARGWPFVVAFLSGYFARSALPWGRTVGTPITAYLLSANSDSEFEDNLAVVATAEVFAFLASIVVALVGLALYAAGGEVAGDLLTNLGFVGGFGVLVIALVVVALSQGWIRPSLFWLAARLESIAGNVPRIPVSDGTLQGRLDGFITTLERIGAARRTLVAAFAVALASWLVNALPLYFGLVALGVDAPIVLAFALAPLASFGGVIPLPGGTGGVEAVLTGLLVATAGLTGDLAAATALLYRLSTYWLHLSVCGLGALYLSATGGPSMVE